MEEQIDEGRREIEECDRVKEKVENMLKELEEEGRREASGGGTISATNGLQDGDGHEPSDEKVAEAKRLWEIINEEVDDD